MAPASRSFQVFAKPAGAACNLSFRYCYYLCKAVSGAGGGSPRMPEGLLERYI
jgi:sulfatase maturation enzyme AslB (radical SAM superfamily)